MPYRASAAPHPPSRPCPARPRGRARAPARPAGSGRPERRIGPAARAAGDRSRLARRRAGARSSARAVRRAGPGGRARLRHGAARPADGGWRPCGLDRPAGRVVRSGLGRAGSRTGAPDHGPGARPRCPSLGARGGAAQPRARRGARRGRPADPDPRPPAAARRRGRGGDRIAPAAARRRREAERRHHALAHRGGPDRAGSGRDAAPERGARLRPAALAGIPAALPRRPHRQLAGRLAQGGLA